MGKTLHVGLPGREYDILIEKGALEEAALPDGAAPGPEVVCSHGFQRGTSVRGTGGEEPA